MHKKRSVANKALIWLIALFVVVFVVSLVVYYFYVPKVGLSPGEFNSQIGGVFMIMFVVSLVVVLAILGVLIYLMLSR